MKVTERDNEKHRQLQMNMPPRKCTLTADNSALIPRKWCMAAGAWCTAAMRSIYSQSPVRFRMESPSILIV